MQINKAKVQANFNKGAITYDQYANIQLNIANDLILFLSQNTNNAYPTILDIGAGTGYVTEALLKRYPHSRYIVNDIAENMLKHCANNLPCIDQISFLLGDAENIELPKADLLISSMVFQWFNNMPLVIQKFTSVAKTLAFSIPCFGTFKEWNEILAIYNMTGITKDYLSYESLIEICKAQKAPFRIERRQYQLVKDSALSLVTYFKRIGACTNSSAQTSQSHRFSRLIKGHGRPINTTYDICFIIIETE